MAYNLYIIITEADRTYYIFDGWHIHKYTCDGKGRRRRRGHIIFNAIFKV